MHAARSGALVAKRTARPKALVCAAAIRYVGHDELALVELACEQLVPLRLRFRYEVGNVDGLRLARAWRITDRAAGEQPDRPWRLGDDPGRGPAGVLHPPSHVDSAAQDHGVVGGAVGHLDRLVHEPVELFGVEGDG